jgi:hypothetical protein
MRQMEKLVPAGSVHALFMGMQAVDTAFVARCPAGTPLRRLGEGTQAAVSEARLEDGSRVARKVSHWLVDWLWAASMPKAFKH